MKRFTIKVSFPEHRDQVVFILASHLANALQRAAVSVRASDLVGFSFKVLSVKELGKTRQYSNTYMED